LLVDIDIRALPWLSLLRSWCLRCTRASDNPPYKEVAPGVLRCVDRPGERRLPEPTTR